MNTGTRSLALDASMEAGGGTVTLACSSELMQHFVAGSPVDPGHRIGAAQDRSGAPMVFSIGTDGHAYVVLAQPGGPTGWRQVDLTPAAAGGAELVALGVSQDRSGAIHLAVATSGSNGSGRSVFVLPPIAAEQQSADWDGASSRWVARKFPAGSIAISEVVVDTTDDAPGSAPTLIVSGVVFGTSGKNGAQHYLVNADATDASWAWKLLPMPENASTVVDVVPFAQPVGRGVVTLYQLTGSGSLDLVFTTFEDPTYHQSLQATLQVPPGAAALAVLPEASGWSDLYIAGDGLYFISSPAIVQGLRNHSSASYQTIAGASVVPGVTELLAAQDSAGTVALWALDRGGAVTATNRCASSMTWSTPLPINQGVAQITGLRSLQTGANELIVLGVDSTLSHLWQDPSNSLWEAGALVLEDTNTTLQIDCYASHMHLAAPDASPSIGTALTIGASQLCYVMINGAGTVLAPTTTATVVTDSLGTVTIVNPVRSITTPIFRVTGDVFAQEVDVNPAAGIMSALSAITSVSDLQNATTQSGQPLIVGSLADQNAPTVVNALTETMTVAKTLPPDGSPTRAQLHTAFATIRPKGAPSTDRLNGGALPAGYAWGVEVRDGVARFHDAESVRANLLPHIEALHAAALVTGATPDRLPLAASSAISDAIGDVLAFLHHAWETVTSVVVHAVDGVVHLVVTLADNVYDAVMTELGHVFGLIDWLFKLIAVDLEKFIDWLGFIFSWSDIKATHAVLSNLGVQALNYTISAVEGAETSVNRFFDHLESTFASMTSVPVSAAAVNVQSQSSQTASADTGVAGIFKHSPVANFSHYQVMHGGVLNANPALPSVSGDLEQLLSDFLTKLVEPTAGAVADTMKNLFDDLRDAFQGGSLTPAQALEKFGADAVVGILEVARKLAVGSLTLLADLTRLLLDSLTVEIHIPILTGLYEKAVGTPMSVLDGLALLAAIPVTVIYKIATGKAPFAGDPLDMSTADFHTLAAAFGHPLSDHAVKLSSFATAAEVARPEHVTALDTSDGPSQAELTYSHVGGYVYTATSALSTSLILYSTLSETEAKWPDRVGVGFSLLAVASSFPVGDDTVKDGLTWERIAWFNTVGELIRDAIALFQPDDALVTVGLLQMAQATCGGVLYLVIMILELVGDYPAVSSVLKFIQNLISSIGDGLGGSAKLIPKDDPDPDTKAAKQLLEVVSAGCSYITCVMNLVTTAMTDADDLHYVF